MKIINNCLTSVEPSDLINGTFIFPAEVDSIATYAFSKCSTSLKKVEIPEHVTHIGTNAFANCVLLESVKLPNGLKRISESMFENCKSLREIEIPESVDFIGAAAFASCSSLKSIKVPDGVLEIYYSTFKNCNNLEDITLGENVTTLFPNAFDNCRSLKEITLPESLSSISLECFAGCTSLKKINLPEKLVHLKSNAFKDCTSLEDIIFPETLIDIGTHCFENCKSLKSVNIPKNVSIGQRAFIGCSSIESAIINCSKISNGVFSDCSSLKNVTTTSPVEKIDDSTFKNCYSLENIEFKEPVKIIGNSAFENCTSLTNVSLPEGLTSIRTSAFMGCGKLESLSLPSTIERISENAFSNCDSLEFLHIPDSAKSMKKFENNALLFFNKTEDGFNLSANRIENSIPTQNINLNYCFLSKYFKYKDILLKEQRNPHIADFYNEFLSTLPEKDVERFIENHNFTFFKQLNFDSPFLNKKTLYKALYNLGAFEPPFVNEKGKKVDYAQKVVGFIISNADTNDFFQKFNDMNIEGFKPEFTDFFLTYYGKDEMIAEEKLKPNFLSLCYNEFEEIQQTNTNNHGSQRQLKATVKKFKSYFLTKKFDGVTEENNEIAQTVSRYFDNQSAFNHAVEIDNHRKKMRINDHILKTPLKESDIFTEIDDYRTKISDSQRKILGNLVDVATNEFSFEWLAKNDPQNFILGKLCSCCSHLEGMGYGIMHASIVHPNIQNLVIRNKNGEIVAKSTLFVNKMGRYGICNNVEVRNGLSNEEIEEVYQKYILGIHEFAKRYNQEHPLLKLRQINVGMTNNDLTYQIDKNRTRARVLLKTANYPKYGHGDGRYRGDSYNAQFIIWSEKEERKGVKQDTKKAKIEQAQEKE